MPFGRTMVISGLGSLLRKLAGLRSTESREIRRRALQAASTPLLQAARRLAPLETGLLRKSLGRRAKTYRSSGTSVIIIGPRSGFKEEVKRKKGYVYSNPTYYAHLTEFGTIHSRGTHWLERAEESTRPEVVSTLKDHLAAGIKNKWNRS